jgi:hypothetical protein
LGIDERGPLKKETNNLIKWVQVGALTKSAEDFRLLVGLLEILGVRKGPQGENQNCLSA